MAKNYNPAGDTALKKSPAVAPAKEKELAEDLLQSKGYVPSAKPRRVNGGQDVTGARHTERNKERLNSTLSKAPAVDEYIDEPVEILKEKPSAFPLFAYIGITLVIVVAMAYVVHLCVEISEWNTRISGYKSTIVELEGEQKDLEYEKGRLYDLEEIERIAREEYGMVSADSLPKEYITSEDGDSIQIMETGEEKSAAGVLMSGFGRTVSNMLSYIN